MRQRRRGGRVGPGVGAEALNVEMASSKVKSWKARSRFVAHFNAFTRIAIVPNLVP